MKYMLLCYDDEGAWAKAGQAAMTAAMEAAVQHSQELDAEGQYLHAAPLEPASTTVIVRVRDGTPIVTDGPFIETREMLGGYFIIDVENLDEAIHVAEQHPGVRFGAVEVRPVLEIPGLPNS